MTFSSSPEQGSHLSQVTKLVERADRLQRRVTPLGFLWGVFKKASDDRVGSLAALFAYYALFAIFPLLLVLVAVLGVVLSGDPALRGQIVNSALGNFPIIGEQLRKNVHSLAGTGVGLSVSTLVILFGARGLASAAQRALNDLYYVPKSRRAGFPIVLGIYVLWTVVVGVGTTLSTAVLGATGIFGFGSYPIALVLDLVVFLGAHRLLVGKAVSFRDLWLGAILGGVGWEILQIFGSLIIRSRLAHASPVYGFFGIVIGLLAWVYLAAYITLLGVEVDLVWRRQLWPRALAGPDETDASRRLYQMQRRMLEDDLEGTNN
ncbi:MAG: YihY/virulence factor BrkB family protein [Acidimicrobiales bacterium]